MPLPQLAVYRHDQGDRTLIALAGEIDLDSVPLVRTALERCLRDGIRSIDVDLTAVSFCECSGLNTFLRASQQATSAGKTLRLHRPPAMLARMLDLTGCGFLLLGLPFGQASPSLGDTPAVVPSGPPRASVPPVSALSADTG
ncbi:STAS domain-containing protein [Streptomyces sp. NPDC088106]|uniref:STAS domain-containing protein n=1 Tax=Streptomyces sp. NPDC088106 TaxID=3154867 RepID=UPI00341DE36C